MIMNKKWIITIGVVLGIVALGIGAYFAWQNRAKIAQVIPAIIGGGVIAPAQPTTQKLRVISSHGVNAYWVVKTASSSDIYYLDNNKTIFNISADGIETTDVMNVRSPLAIIPSPAGSWLFITVNTGGDATIYDIGNNKQIRDFFGTSAIAWGLEEGKIARIASGDSAGAPTPQIVVEDVKNASVVAKTIIKSNILQGFGLQWPRADALFLTQKPSADYISDMWKVDIKTGKLSKFLSDRGLIVQWAPFGDRALEFTTTEGRAHRLSLIDSTGNRLKEMKFITMPNKCVMVTGSQMYCAIPRDQESLTHMTLPDDYLKRNVYFKDGIYQIDIDRDSIRGIFEDENPDIDATNLTVVGNKLLFINRYDRKLYSLDLQ